MLRRIVLHGLGLAGLLVTLDGAGLKEGGQLLAPRTELCYTYPWRSSGNRLPYATGAWIVMKVLVDISTLTYCRRSGIPRHANAPKRIRGRKAPP